MSTKFIKNQSDWTCPDPNCANVNFARRDACNRCGKSKPIDKVKKIGREIGKNLAEKSKGLFSADDWQCTQCGNVNWARRSTCNICNAPKFGKVEQRTGFGGGYNERENVEYIERDESDSEYDEFGRKKKKFRGNLKDGEEEEEENSESVVPSTAVNIEKDIKIEEIKTNDFDDFEDEEEDDDDENEDLSKYQLDASDQENGGEENAFNSSSSSDDSETGDALDESTSDSSSQDGTSDSESDASSRSDAGKCDIQNGDDIEGGKRKDTHSLPSEQKVNKKLKNTSSAPDRDAGTPSEDESN